MLSILLILISQTPTVPETLYYDDGTVYSGWGAYNVSGWGYYFNAAHPCSITAVGVYTFQVWPGGNHVCAIRVTDWDGNYPGHLYNEWTIFMNNNSWTWSTLLHPIYDDDGEFCAFFIFRDNYPYTTALAEDSLQEDTMPDWTVIGNEYFHGFPRNDFLVRVAVKYNTGVGEILPVGVRLPKLPTLCRGSFTIRFGFSEPTPVILSVYNLTGARVRKWQRTAQDQIPVDLSRLPDGIYFLRIETKAGIETNKLIILH